MSITFFILSLIIITSIFIQKMIIFCDGFCVDSYGVVLSPFLFIKDIWVNKRRCIWFIITKYIKNLTCAPKTHDKLPKSRKLAFNEIKYLMLWKLNAQISRKYFYINILSMCALGAQVNIFLYLFMRIIKFNLQPCTKKKNKFTTKRFVHKF
jgi:hypothetical protein